MEKQSESTSVDKLNELLRSEAVTEWAGRLIRNKFAAAALTGILLGEFIGPERAAKAAFEYADAMLKEAVRGL